MKSDLKKYVNICGAVKMCGRFFVGCKHNISDLGLRSGGSCGCAASRVQVDLDETRTKTSND